MIQDKRYRITSETGKEKPRAVHYCRCLQRIVISNLVYEIKLCVVDVHPAARNLLKMTVIKPAAIVLDKLMHQE